MAHDPHTDAAADCRLHSFERNRFFHGKLMTARDMAAEQEYHAERLETVTRHVAGEGIVCGLETTVSQSEGSLSVTVEPGLALDACGRPVVVEHETTETFEPHEVPDGDGVSVYLDYGECVTETVPVPGSEDACEEDCEHNRTRETFRVELGGGSPAIPDDADDDGPKGGKRVRHVEFPTSETLGVEPGATPDPTNQALSQIARSYSQEDGELRACDADDDATVFLGYFTKTGETWSRVDPGDVAGESRPYVYTNDMLYAAISRHAADFGNPHEVTAAQTGGIGSVEGVANPGGDVALESSDGTVSIDGDDAEDRVDFAVSSDITAQLDAHARYVMDKTLKYTIEAYYDVATTFDDETAGKVVNVTKEAVFDRVHADREAFRSFVENVLDVETNLKDKLEDVVTAESFDRYEAALQRLNEALDDGTVVDVAAAQDEVSEAARSLRTAEEPQVGVPGGYTLPAGMVDQPLRPSRQFEVPDYTGEKVGNVYDMLANEKYAVNFQTKTGETVTEETASEYEIVSGGVVTESGDTPQLTFVVDEPKPLDTLTDVGTSRMTTMNELGVESVAQLAKASDETLTQIADNTGVSKEKVIEWQKQAKETMGT